MNIKKIGLSALAGSLAMFSANAVEVAVSGKTEITYSTKDLGSNGNPFGMGNPLTFSGSGDVNGMTATYTAVIQDGGQANSNTSETFASSSLMLDMGDMGTLGFDQGIGEFGVGTIDDKTPSAYEEVWDGLGGTKTGYVSQASSGFEYTNTSMDGVKVEIAYGTSQAANDDGGVGGAGSLRSSESIAIQYTGIEGANIFFGTGTVGESATTDTDVDTMGATYSMGAATVGLQRSTVDTAALAEHENTSYSISFAVNDDLSVSYAERTVDIGGNTVDEEQSGISVGYSMGGMTIKAHNNVVDNVAGAATNDLEHMEIAVSFAF